MKMLFSELLSENNYFIHPLEVTVLQRTEASKLQNSRSVTAGTNVLIWELKGFLSGIQRETEKRLNFDPTWPPSPQK